MGALKAMRLPEIFGLSTFPVFWVSRYFEVRNNSGIRVPVSKVRKFCETYRKFSQKCLPKICQKYTGIFEKSTVSAENSGTFLKIWLQNRPKLTKYGKKMVKNPENYTGIFDFLQKMTDFRLSPDCQKCTELFGFLFSR